MKITPIVVLLVLVLTTAQAQQKAITETGETVILYEDGTWRYQDETAVKETVIPTNPTPFKKDKKSSFLLKSKRVDMGFWLDPKVWSFKKPDGDSDAEYELQLRDGALYGMVICEKIELPLETLKFAALSNAKSVAPDMKVVNEEYRMVNGLKVLFLHMEGTLQGIKFSYYGYYFSNASGSVQLLTYTSQSLMKTYKADCERLLNGIVELD